MPTEQREFQRLLGELDYSLVIVTARSDELAALFGGETGDEVD